jgi:hypothetical protein
MGMLVGKAFLGVGAKLILFCNLVCGSRNRTDGRDRSTPCAGHIHRIVDAISVGIPD